MKMNNNAEAAVYLEKAHALSPGDISVYKNFTEALIYSRQLERAKNNLEQLSRTADTDEILYLYG